ncbi:mitochondrial ribosomal protein L16 [Cristinia sonorae]|uniref:Mitochondrial ribosomal protein L16 n=1 Tax=Cristinia sonorae TaxID=1940300 RepID=A0A8K0UEZ7_9AGAR|nr:mitochondrial ribosomal protein L16 [Cristinia sonorae]
MLSLPSARSLLTACRRTILSPVQPSPLVNPLFIQSRFKSQLAPRRIHFIKRHKGVLPIPTGGSIKGTTLAFGDWGIRIRENGARLSARQLTAAEEVIKRKLKIVKGARTWMRVFPDVPVCIKGNETRMGKGKGSFEFWATRVAPGRVLFEIGGVAVREELAREALRLACDKLPVMCEFITRDTPPRLGNLVLTPEEAIKTPETVATSTPSASS